jgi:hypothetical protein
MRTEATSRNAAPMPCSHCGAALPEHAAVCPQCGASALLDALPVAELVPPPTLVPARILRAPITPIAPMDDAGTIVTAPTRIQPLDLNGARRWGMSRGAAILLFGFAAAFGGYVAITQRDVAQVRWQRILNPSAPRTLPSGIGSSVPPPSPIPFIAMLEREIDRSRAEDAQDEQTVQKELANGSQAAAKKPEIASAAAAPVPTPTPAHSPKPKAVALASVAPGREHAAEPRGADKVVDKKTETLAARTPDQTADKLVEKPAAVAVQGALALALQAPAVQPLEAPLGKSAAAAAERPVEKTPSAVVDKPAEKSATIVAERSTEKSMTTSAEKPVEKATTPAAERSAEKAAATVTERSPEKVATTSAERSAEKAMTSATERSAEKAPVAAAERPAEKTAIAAAERATERTETPKPPPPRVAGTNEQRADVIQRAALACDKQDAPGCIRRQLTRGEGGEAPEAGTAEPKAPPRERVTREPLRTADGATPFDVARKGPAPEAVAVAAREPAASRPGEAVLAKAVPDPLLRYAFTEDERRLYRGH